MMILQKRDSALLCRDDVELSVKSLQPRLLRFCGFIKSCHYIVTTDSIRLFILSFKEFDYHYQQKIEIYIQKRIMICVHFQLPKRYLNLLIARAGPGHRQ